MKRFETTPGRMLLGETLPKSHKVPFETVNRLLTKKEIGDVIDIVYRHTGQKETVLFADAIMGLGFRHAFKAGISFGKDDMIIPHEKVGLVDETRALVKDYEQQYQDGLITQQEKYNKVIDAWSRCGDQVANAMMEKIKAQPKGEDGRMAQINSIYMMAHSGARGSQAQMKQLAGMRGLMAKPSGEIIETPIISNFKEGLTVLEYFNSTHGARKGLADTALKTANSGYLTRRLVDVSQDCVDRRGGLRTENALDMRAIVQGGAVIASLGERILGRTPAEDIVDAKTGDVLAKEGELIDEAAALRIDEIGRPVGPASARLWSARASMASAANATGAISPAARRSISARRSASSPPSRSASRAPSSPCGPSTSAAPPSSTRPRASRPRCDGTIELPRPADDHRSRGRRVAMSRNGELAIVDMDGRERASHRIPYGAHLMADHGHIVSKGDRIAEWDPFMMPVITEKGGIVKFQDLVEGKTLTEQTDEATGIAQRVVTEYRGSARSKEDLRPRITLLDEKSGEAARYMLAPGAMLSVEDGQRVEAGEVLARVSPRGRQDPRHHRRSAAGGGAVRGAQAQGECDHRQGLRPGRVRQGLQGQAQDRDHPR